MVRWVIYRIYDAQGWQIEGSIPDIPKMVIAGGPHTSNWDFVFFAGATHAMGVEPNFLGKHTLFRGMMRNFMFDMGGIPVDRTPNTNVVEQVAAEFDRRDKLALVMAAEGTRKSDGTWRSGFYHIAQAANVPIIPAFAYREKKMVGFAPPLYPSGNFGQDLMKIAKWLRSVRPDYERYKVLERQAQRLIDEQEGQEEQEGLEDQSGASNSR